MSPNKKVGKQIRPAPQDHAEIIAPIAPTITPNQLFANLVMPQIPNPSPNSVAPTGIEISSEVNISIVIGEKRKLLKNKRRSPFFQESGRLKVIAL
ncbi:MULTISPECIES: hypothetical protein [Spirulina sp. CCY15215]|uniref:hypothetical protein n=1 Tax=Spirulina sp. CCY15215 TaxID=2767591 RepID=UPI001950454E|nr:hypothetical protein [Spirulina major]